METVVISPSWTENVFDHWQRYSWTGGPHASDDPPSFPSPDWQPNVQGDPHGIGVAGAYFRSHGNSGNGDWFYLEAVTTEVIHEAVTEDIYHEGTECPTETPTDTPSTDIPTTENPTETPTTDGPTDTPTETPSTDGPTDTPTTDIPVTEPPVNTEDPIVHTDSTSTKRKTVKVYTHRSGKKTREVVHYPAQLEEEGY